MCAGALVLADGYACKRVMLCYVMVPLLSPINYVEDSWGWRLQGTHAKELYFKIIYFE
jgi:hypothetical protein